MFEWDWVDDLDGNGAADELARARDLLLHAEAGRMVLAAHWGMLHAGDFMDECRAQLPGTPRSTVRGVDGVPELDEGAGAELAALLGMSPASGEQLLADAVTLQHRHPRLWARLRRGGAQVWLARKVARRCVTLRLSRDQAHRLDARTTPYAGSLGPRRFLDLVEAVAIELLGDAEADGHAPRTRPAASLTAGRSDDDGMRTLVVRARAGDVAAVLAFTDRVAEILADQGSRESLDERRVTALRLLTNPARALALLCGATLEALDPQQETSSLHLDDGPAQHGEGEYLSADGEWVWSGLRPHPAEPALLPDDAVEAAVAEDRVLGERTAVLRDLARSLQTFDASALDPLTVFHVHVSGESLTRGRGVCRVEDLGAWSLGAVRDWLTHPSSPDDVRHQVRVRPVLDLAGVPPVDRYEVPDRMAEAVRQRDPYCAVPWGTLPARRGDLDHVVAYDPGGPPGQTRPGNLVPLPRRHHRLKTRGSWRLVHPEPGVYWWRTHHGHWFRIDAAGTHHHGRDPALDQAWLAQRN